MLSDLPSCVYANHSNNNNCSNPGNNGRPNNNFRQIPNQYLHHSGEFLGKAFLLSINYNFLKFTDCLDSSTPNMGLNSNMGGYGSPYKLCRQQSGIRERKRIQRSAPTGYLNLVLFIGSVLTLILTFFQKHQLSFRWAQSARSNFSLREKVEQDWYTSFSYRLHSPSSRSVDHRLWSFDIGGKMLEGGNQSRQSSLEHKWWVSYNFVCDWNT